MRALQESGLRSCVKEVVVERAWLYFTVIHASRKFRGGHFTMAISNRERFEGVWNLGSSSNHQ